MQELRVVPKVKKRRHARIRNLCVKVNVFASTWQQVVQAGRWDAGKSAWNQNQKGFMPMDPGGKKKLGETEFSAKFKDAKTGFAAVLGQTERDFFCDSYPRNAVTRRLLGSVCD